MQSITELEEEVYARPKQAFVILSVHCNQPHQEFTPNVHCLSSGDGFGKFISLQINDSCSIFLTKERLVELRDVINAGIEKHVCPLHGETA